MNIKYINHKFRGSTVELIEVCNNILEDLVEQGFNPTLRQLYYQLVGRDIIENTVQSYDRLGKTITKARDAGLISWHHLEDRVRQCKARAHWEGGSEFLEDVADQCNLDLWEGQSVRCEVWIEKEALSEVARFASLPYDVPYFANKGYISSSAAWDAAHNRFLEKGGDWVILHLGDHDPSGIDMTRDIEDRLYTYSTPYDKRDRPNIEVKRLALNIDQIQHYNPPPNPAKVTDSRYKNYSAKFGEESWELDALEPNTLIQIIQDEIVGMLDMDLFNKRKAEEQEVRKCLKRAAENYDDWY